MFLCRETRRKYLLIEMDRIRNVGVCTIFFPYQEVPVDFIDVFFNFAFHLSRLV
jgi:hypothetical protein